MTYHPTHNYVFSPMQCPQNILFESENICVECYTGKAQSKQPAASPHTLKLFRLSANKWQRCTKGQFCSAWKSVISTWCQLTMVTGVLFTAVWELFNCAGNKLSKSPSPVSLFFRRKISFTNLACNRSFALLFFHPKIYWLFTNTIKCGEEGL